MSDFAEALALVLRMEGGRVDDPRDPGGRTNQGVTQHTYDAWRRARGLACRTVYAIDAYEIEHIYADDFARPLRFDELPPGIAYAVLDCGVHSGPVRSIGLAQRALGRARTGHMDLATVAAVRATAISPFIDRLCDLRLGFLRILPGWVPFGRGWANRIAFVRRHAHAMARPRADDPPKAA